MLASVRCRCGHASAWTIRREQPASMYCLAITSGVYTMRCASNGSVVCGRAAAITSGPNVRLGTNWPSITSHWMRSTPAASERGHLLAEAGEVGRQHRRDDLDRSAHRCGNLALSAHVSPVLSVSSSGPFHSSSASSHVSLRCSTVLRQFSASARDAYGPSMSSPGPRWAAGTATPRRRSKYHCSLIGSTLPRSVGVADPRSYAARMQLTVRTDRLVAGGDAMGRADDGRVVFVTGALPGELVDAEIVEEKKDFVRSRVNLVLEPSVDRQVPVCPHRRAGCGGCGWMHLEPAAQFRAKAEIVRESLRRIGRLDAAVVDDLVRSGGAVDPFGYRTTIRVVGGPDGTLGYREERSDRIVPITSCPIAESALSRLLSVIHLDEGAEITLRTSIATGQITAIWSRDHRKAVHDVPSRRPHRRARLVDRTDRRRRTAGVGGLVLPIGGAGRRVARRRRRSGRTRTRHRRARRRRVRRRRVVRRHGDGNRRPRHGDRVVEVGVLRRQAQPGRPGDDREGGSRAAGARIRADPSTSWWPTRHAPDSASRAPTC